MNKKSLVLLSAIALSSLAGCGSKTSSSSTAKPSTPAAEAKVQYSLGLGYTTSFKSTQAAVTAVAATFDKDGKVVNARIDEVQVPLTVVESTGEEGETVRTAAVNGTKNPNLLSKQELGTDYNMLGTSQSVGIGKELYEQVESLAKYMEGKTVAELKAVVAENGKLTDAAKEASSCSVTASGYIAALEDAYNTRKAAIEGTAAKIGVGMYVGMYGKSELTAYIAGASTDASGKVEAMDVDNVVFPLTVKEVAGEEGTTYEASTDTSSKYYVDGRLTSKKDIGDAYAMESIMHNPCGEWYEQASAIENGLVGKTGAEVAATTELASVSIKIEDIIKSAAEAATYAMKAVITDKPVA